MSKKNKITVFFKASALTFVLLFAICSNPTSASSSISNAKEAANFVLEKLSINEDDVLIYVWGPVYRGEEVLSTKDNIMVTPDKGYIIYIDLYPKANLFHPVKYVFLSEDTNEFVVKGSIYPPKNFACYQMIDTEFGKIFSQAQNRRAIVSEKETSSSEKGRDSRWAVLMNGGYDSGNNHIRYWNDLSNIYSTLTSVYNYLDENIIVLCSDGTNPAPDQSNGQNSDPDLDGDGDDDIMYSCVLSNVDLVFADLANILTEGSELFVFTTDHGSSMGGYDTLFNLWNYEELTDAHFASLLAELSIREVVCTFEPCFSGGFLDNVVVPPGPVVASSACNYDEYSYAMNNLEYDEYVFYWTAAVNGIDAYGNPHDADYNLDGYVTMDEAHIYAESHDEASESPQYDDYPEGVGALISLWPGSEPPETPSKPEGPSIWTTDVETKFTSSTTDPEGESILYLFDWGDGNNSGWIGPYASGQTAEVTHIWTEIGEYQVKVKAKDINDVSSDWSEPATITIIVNSPPNKPVITGSNKVQAMKQYTYTVSAEDPDGHNVYYYVWWGDGDFVEWAGPYASGEKIIVKNAWPEVGSYTIQVKAMDFVGEKSEVTSLQINVVKNKATSNTLLQKLLSHFTNIFPALKLFIK